MDNHFIKKQKISAIFFDRTNIGIACFDQKCPVIKCSQILELCQLNFKHVASKLKNSSTVITNSPNHKILDVFLEISQNGKIIQFDQKNLQNEIIYTHLNMINCQNIHYVKNKDHYYKQMSQDGLKFKSLGILLYHLLNETPIFNRTRFYLENIQFWTDYLFKHVGIDQKVLEYLQISIEENHPSLVRGKGKGKEGFSILSIYDSYLTGKGSKQILRNIILNPMFDVKQLQKRFEIIQWMKYEMRDFQKFKYLFRNIHSFQRILKKIQKMESQQEDWRKLIKTMESIEQLRKILYYANTQHIIKQFLQYDGWAQFTHLLLILKRTIELSPLAIKPGVNKDLDQMKEIFEQLPSLLLSIAKQQGWNFQCKILFISQIGYLLKVPYEVKLPQQMQSQWEEEFSNNFGRYYSNQLTKQLDVEFGDLYGEIRDAQKKILFEVEDLVTDTAQILMDFYWKIQEIQCYWGISQISKNMCKPKLSSEGLIISDGWHILLAQNAIGNNTFSFNHDVGPKNRVYNSEMNLVNTNYSNRCTILTGPNGSGKTVYLKQISLIIYLAHCGLFVPAGFAQIPLIERIIVVQSSSDTFSKLCGFQRQLDTLSKALNSKIVTNKSLILIDELGLTIDFKFGLKILYATVMLLSKNKFAKFKKNKVLQHSSDHFETPLSIIITHLTEMMTSELIEQNYYSRFLMMDVQNDQIFLYKIKPGLVRSGYGIINASSLIKKEIIDIANIFWERLKQ